MYSNRKTAGNNMKWRSIMANQEKESKDVQMNIRLKPEVAERVKLLFKELSPATQSAAMEQILNVCEMSELLKTDYGQTVNECSKDFMAHIVALTTHHKFMIQHGEDVKKAVIADMERKYAGKNDLIDKLKQEVQDQKESLAYLKNDLKEARRSEDAALAAKNLAEEAAENAKKSESAWKQNVDTLSKQIEMLTSQLDEAKTAISKAEETEEKCKSLEAELAKANGTIAGLQAVIDKYMTK